MMQDGFVLIAIVFFFASVRVISWIVFLPEE